MADVPASLQSIERVARVLVEARVPYAFIGGVALNTWGIPRATFDLDLAIALEDASSPHLLRCFREAGFLVDTAFETGFRDHVAGMEKVHLHLPTAVSLMETLGPYERGREGCPIRVAVVDFSPRYLVTTSPLSRYVRHVA